MPSLQDPAVRTAILARLDALTPTATPRWGSMTASRMLAHMSDAMRMSLGELQVKPRPIPVVPAPLVKWLMLNVIPFPKDAPTAPEIIARAPEEFEAERRSARALVERISRTETLAPAHPLFGRMSRTDWGKLGYKHFDHHLRQFGV
jgi:Protein of unknown function (DUF1569)